MATLAETDLQVVQNRRKERPPIANHFELLPRRLNPRQTQRATSCRPPCCGAGFQNGKVFSSAPPKYSRAGQATVYRYSQLPGPSIRAAARRAVPANDPQHLRVFGVIRFIATISAPSPKSLGLRLQVSWMFSRRERSAAICIITVERVRQPPSLDNQLVIRFHL